MSNLKSIIRPNILKLTPYSSARDEFSNIADVYLDANENPFGNGYNRYPDPYQEKLKARIAGLKKVSVENVLLGNGSDEVLDLIFRAFCEPGIDNCIAPNPSYGMYKVLAEVNNIELKKIDLSVDFELDGQDMVDASDDKTKLFFICSPNNPSGNLLDRSEIRKVLDLNIGLVVIDEAYIDFCDETSWISELKNYPNLIVCQTLSKAWGMAGLRIGMCFASEEIITVLNSIKPPYNVNELSQKAALETLSNETKFNEQLKLILSERKRLKTSLLQFESVVKLYWTDANFILVQVDDADKMYNFLLERKVIVRNRSKELNCNNCIRITVGTVEENNRLLACLKEYS